MRRKVSEQAKLHKASQILIEDAGFGTALIQELKTAHFSVVAVKPEYDKKIRMAIQSTKFENGQVFFPKEAPWLRDLEDELFAFPNSRHDDQVDSISQALGHKIACVLDQRKPRQLQQFRERPLAGCNLRAALPAAHGKKVRRCSKQRST